MSYEVDRNLTVKSDSWRDVSVYFCGFTANGSLRYDILDETVNVGKRIIRIYIIPAKKTVRAFQGRRKVEFVWSDAVDGNAPHYLIQKILNFLMW